MSKATLLESDLPLTDDPGASFTMPARWYLDAEIYEREKQTIFYRNWHYVTHQSALKNTGDYATLRIADENILVICGADGELRGFYNVCKHRAHELLSGSGNTQSIVCPYHAWSYELDGKLRYARKADTLPGFDKNRYCLTSVRVENLCGFIFVNLDPDALPLAEQAADLAEDMYSKLPWLDELQVIDYNYFGDSATQANWKVVVDNYVECYHCTPAHPAFADMIDMDDYRMDAFALWSRQLGPQTRPNNSAYHFSADAPVQRAAFWYLWPTTTINTIPGEKMVQVLSIQPLSLETTAFAGHRLALDDRPDKERLDYLFNVLGPEDQALVESVPARFKIAFL